jgi:hypothetical protein
MNNKAPSPLSSWKCRSAGLARVCLAQPQIAPHPARQRRQRQKANGANRNHHSLEVVSLAGSPAQHGYAMLQSPYPKLHSGSAL